MDIDAISLLKTHSVVEVRDLDLEVSGNAAKLYDKFAQELKEQYGEILDVTKSVGELFGCLKTADFELRDLCFRDDLYKLKKLELLEGKIDRANGRENPVDHGDSANKVLLISNWSLAISNFISRFGLSLSSSKLFDQVIIQFQNLHEYGHWQEYEEVITGKCEQFVQYLLDSSVNNVNFSTQQWARIWSLVLKSTSFPWNRAQQLKLEDIVFQSLFKEPLEVLMNDADEEVSKLVHSSEFEQKLNAKIMQDIERQFQLLEELVTQQEDNTPTFKYPKAIQEVDVAQVVENCRLHSIGLTTRSRVHMYRLVNPLKQMLDNLQAHGGQPDQIAELRKRLATLLENKIPVDAEQGKKPSESLTMDKIVENLMTNQNNLSASQLIHKQINALRV